MIKHFICILISSFFIHLFFPVNIYSQDSTGLHVKSDSTKKLTSKDTSYVPPLISFSKYRYISLSNPDTISRSRFLWYPSRDFINLFDNMPGYFLNYMDEGQIQRLNYDQLDNHYTTVLRHGRPINDLLDGSADFNLFSRNEIEEVEMSNGFGNSLYPFNNVINTVSRQVFRDRPFSEISYWQDLNENLNFDGSFHKNFFNLLNFNFGITKHSYDGYYANSSFDQWAGRFNFNYIGSKKFNAFLYSNYSKIQRGLNDGLDVSQLMTFTRDEVFLSTAAVLNPNANETRERFDIDAGAIYAYGKDLNSFLKIQLFESNSVRRYQDTTFVDNSHWINYGLKLQNVYDMRFGKDIRVQSSSEAELNWDFVNAKQKNAKLYGLGNISKSSRDFFIENLALTYRNLSVNGFIKSYKYAYFDNKFYTNYGIASQLDILKDSSYNVQLFASYNYANRLPNYLEHGLLQNAE
ncbi:MAG: hypothetical protein ACHQJ4_04840, partial [Ignavibacteria bacterium]